MRYSRQEILSFIPKKFQEGLRNKYLVVVGCGGIGSPLAELLVRGGFKNLILIDNDIIDESNLNRQIFFEEDIGKYKSKTLKDYLLKIDSSANIEFIIDLVDEKNIHSICNNSDLIIDASDNFETRRLINKYCEEYNKPWLYNGAIKTEIISCLFEGRDFLFSKVFPNKIVDEKCCELGILPSTTFISAGIAFNQITKYFLNGKSDRKLIKFNSWENKFYEINLRD